MGEESRIQWTKHSYSPWWGCVEVSEACDHCYARELAHRWAFDVWGKEAPRRFFGDKHWNEPLKWDRKGQAAGERHRVFCSSMADVFEVRDDLDAPRARLWDLIRKTPNLNWLLLTKRPEQMPGMAPWGKEWPDNVWAGTTVERQKWARIRIPKLAKVPATVRFLSVEPLLEEIDLSPWLEEIDWVIVGCESGSKAREMNWDWVRKLRDQCVGSGISFFLKQGMVDGKLEGLPKLDGMEWAQVPAGSAKCSERS